MWGTNDNLQCYKRRADSRRKKKAPRDAATAVGVRAARPNIIWRERVEHTFKKILANIYTGNPDTDS